MGDFDSLQTRGKHNNDDVDAGAHDLDYPLDDPTGIYLVSTGIAAAIYGACLTWLSV